MVPLRLALAHSYNAAAARLGTELGVERVLANVRKLGSSARCVHSPLPCSARWT